MKYLVTIAGQTLDVEVDGERVLLNGVLHTAELRAVPGTPVRNLLLDGSSWILPIEATGKGQWMIQRRGERFDIGVVDERTHHIQSLVGASKADTGPVALKAPMPGLVMKVMVEAGEVVAAGQGLVVLEAMKMENELKAAGPAVVDTVLVKPGQAVEKGAALVTFKKA